MRCSNYTRVSGYDGPPLEGDFLEAISIVWLLADPPPTPRAHMVMFYLYGLIGTLGFVGNAFVLFKWVQRRWRE